MQVRYQHPEAQLRREGAGESRRGGFLVLAVFCLIACFAFASLSVDVGYISMTKTRMQNGVDAAALAAVQEIANAVRNAPQGTQDVTAYALGRARQVAADVAALNGIYVDPQRDIEFGQRTSNAAQGTWSIKWGVTPANTARVFARRTNTDPTAPDSRLPLFFAGIGGRNSTQVETQAVAYVEARDMVVVHDFSRSMNFDSQFSDEAVSRLSDNQIVNNLSVLWSDLEAQDIDFGNLDFDPQPLTLSNTSQKITTSVTFRYDAADVRTSGTLKSIKLTFSNNSISTYNVSGKTATVQGSRDITSVSVTSVGDEQPAEAVTLKSSNVTVDFSSNRKTAEISSKSKKLSSIKVLFQDGSSTTFSTPNSKTYTYTPSKPIDSLQIDLSGGGTNWINFDPPEDGSGSNTEVTQQFDDTNSNVKVAFGLSQLSYPFPQGSWDEFINHCRSYSPFASRGYRETYGGLTFANYVLRLRSSHSETPALCQARHYPFSSIKQGHELLCNFLSNLGFDDQLGMVSYDTSHRVEKVLNESDPAIPSVDLSRDPISPDFTAVNNLMKYKQANHYSPSTNMGGGLEEAISLLNNSARAGTRPTILLMTDGNSNVMDSGKNGTLPRDWDWDALFDYDGDGAGDYATSSTQARYVLKTAYDAYNRGYTIHTMSVGMDADRDLLKAVAFIGGGIYIDVPGGTSVSEMEDDLLAGFYKIASQVPPAKLISNP